MSKRLAEQYATLKGTSVIASRIQPDGSITFVLESGPKLTMNAEQLEVEIASLQRDRKPAGPFAYIEEAVKEETPAERRKRLKAEAEAKKTASKTE
jgi:hypothetical protein